MGISFDSLIRVLIAEENTLAFNLHLLKLDNWSHENLPKNDRFQMTKNKFSPKWANKTIFISDFSSYTDYFSYDIFSSQLKLSVFGVRTSDRLEKYCLSKQLYTRYLLTKMTLIFLILGSMIIKVWLNKFELLSILIYKSSRL